MNLYTDGTTQATTEDLAAAAAVDYAAAREATASEIQETIDDESIPSIEHLRLHTNSF